uniref:Reverse transcriptase domain-containing protein n=1 Tax=Tanacetum cinerariifolium TaxID=118510 RepID=A0A6L2JJP9_TANCI|nr:reverse transcriptase domain-containing protein [Tanacetum cinerariifolium]
MRGDAPLSRNETLNFIIVRFNSLNNGVKKIREISPANTKGVLRCTDTEEKIIVNNYLEQTVTIGKQLPEHFKERGDINKETLKDFLIEAPPEDNRKEVGRKADTKLEETKPSCEWKLYTDGASISNGSDARLMLIDPEGKEYTYALRFEFETTNIEAEYEALLAGLRIAQEMELVNLAIFVDSQLLANKIMGIYATKQPTIREYLQRTEEILKRYKSYTIEHVRRYQNKKANALIKLALMAFEHLTKEVLVKVHARRLIEEKEVL